MLKKYLPLLALLAFLILLIPLMLLRMRTSNSDINPFSFTTPTPIPVMTNGGKTIVPSGTQQIQAPTDAPADIFSSLVTSVYPADKSTNRPINQQILLTFNTDFNMKDISFFIQPNIAYTLKKEGKVLRITPKEPLQQATTYSYSVNITTNPASPVLSFTTVGGTPSTQPDTYVAPNQQDQQYTQSNQPDIYLYNYVPYQDSLFSVTGDFTSSPTDHFFFTVILTGTDKNTSKQDFLSWVKQQGLTEQQISSLDIRYQ